MAMAKVNVNASYNFASYLLSLYIKQDEKCTHTRLKNVELGIKGGAYLILDSELEEFYKKYYNHVFVEVKQEYLTEIQLHDAGPVLVDFDFKYDVSVDERQHTKDHVVDMVLLYMNALKKFLKIDAGVDIPVFDALEFGASDYDLFSMPLWLDLAIEAFREVVILNQEILTKQQGLAVLRQELRITTQRVNLFEKVKIPLAEENIRLIKIYIGDQMANAVGRCKIAKRKIEALILEEVAA